MLLQRVFYISLRKMSKYLPSGVHFSTSSTYKEEKIKIRNYEINYLRVGRGPHHVFCAPGSMGTIWSDFRKQIEGFDRDQFSLVVWDPPGYGKSIALDKEEPDMLRLEVDFAYEFMKALQIPKYSTLGWSFGGIVSLLLAGRYPDVINKVAAWGCGTFFLPHEIEELKKLKNLNNWSKSTREALIQLYGEESFIKKINKMIDSKVEFYDRKETSCHKVRPIKCPALLLHGGKDPIVDCRHLDHLKGLITNSRTHLYPDGGHKIHFQYADDFNKRVQEFLLEAN